MINRSFYFYCSFIILFHAKYLQAYSCNVCDPVYFNYTVTVDNLPPPEGPNCQVISSDTGCFARIAWYDDHASGVFYETNLGLPRETISVNIQRQSEHIISPLQYTEFYHLYVWHLRNQGLQYTGKLATQYYGNHASFQRTTSPIRRIDCSFGRFQW